MSTGPRLLIACSATNLFRVYIGGTYKINVAGNLAAGNQVLCIFTHDGTNSALYVNGERRGESTGAFGTENADSWYLGSGYNGQVDAVYGLHAQWSRALSESECTDLSANPWQLFRANPVRFYSLPSGPITLNSLTASNITSSGSRFTVGLTR